MTLGKHPLSLHVYSTVHFFERFSYYGILSLLVLYLVKELHFTDGRAYAIIGVYGTLTYATPLLGGYIADRFIGFYSALIMGLSFILLGHLSIFSLQTEIGLFLGLGLVVTGSGFYKSNMNALIGNLYNKKSLLKDAAYTIFYVYQNAGAFIAPVLCGFIGLTYGWIYGFSLAGLAGVSALVTLCFAGKFKRIQGSSHSLVKNFRWKIVLSLLIGGSILSILLSFTIYYGEDTLDLLMGLTLVYFLIYVKHFFSVEKKDRGKMIVIFFGILAVALSGALVSHGGTVFTLFMSRNVNPALLSFEVPITFIQAIDPLAVVIFGPLVAVLWRILSKKKKRIPGIIKTLMGFGLIVLSYAYLYTLCNFADVNQQVTVLPLILGLSFLAASDILIYPNVLTFCSRLTPKGLTGMVMGFIVFGLSLSELLGTYIARLSSLQIGTEKIDRTYSLQVYQDFFSTMTLLSLLTLIVLSFFVWLIYKKKNKYRP